MYISRGIRRPLAAVAGLALTTGLALSGAAPAHAVVPTCGGFTAVDAAALGYVVDELPAAGGAVNYAGDPAWHWVLGGAGPDIIQTGDGNDLICGRGGNDTITSNGAEDDVWGDADADTIDLGPGDFDYAEGNGGVDTISGGPGPDFVYGDGPTLKVSDARDVINGGGGNDTLNGGGGPDELYGNQDDDVLRGDDAADHLDGGVGNNDLDGGNNLNDTCVNGPIFANCP